jgi:hypothetical protein
MAFSDPWEQSIRPLQMCFFPWGQSGAGSASASESAGETSGLYFFWPCWEGFSSGKPPSAGGCGRYFRDFGSFSVGFSGFSCFPGKKFWKLQKFCLHL